MKLTNHIFLALKLRIIGDITLLPHTPSWRGQGHFTDYLFFYIIGYTSVKDFIVVRLNTHVCFFKFYVISLGNLFPTFGRHSVREPLEPWRYLFKVLGTDCTVTRWLIPKGRPVYFTLLQVFHVACTWTHFDMFNYLFKINKKQKDTLLSFRVLKTPVLIWPQRTAGDRQAWIGKEVKKYLLTYLLHGAESFLRS